MYLVNSGMMKFDYVKLIIFGNVKSVVVENLVENVNEVICC